MKFITMRIGAAVLAAAVAGAGALAFYPLETVVAYQRASLAWGGVKRVRLGGVDAYMRDGCRPGEPCRCVALVHGLGDSSMTWNKMLLDPRASSPGLLLAAVDMPGTESSPPPRDDAGWGIRAQARALRASLEPRCPRWEVAGNSLGGWVALWLAVDWPEGVERLVLASPAGISDPSGAAERAARVLADPDVAKLKVFARLASFAERDVPDRAYGSLVETIKSRRTSRTVAALRREELLDGRLKSLRAPTTIVWGESDGVIPIEVGRRMSRLIPRGQFQPVQRCGHLPQQECPEAFARVLFEQADLLH